MRRLIGIALLAVFASAADSDQEGVVNYSKAVDRVVLGALDSLRNTLTNLTIEDMKESFTSTNLNVTFELKNMNLSEAEKFENPVLKTTIVPIEIRNLTLTWKRMVFEVDYDFSGRLNLDELQNMTEVYGKGKGRLSAADVFLTSGAKFHIVNGVIEIQPKGLYNFDAYVRETNVTIDSIMGSTEVGKMAGIFLSNALPQVLNVVKQPLFEAFHEDLVKLLNAFLSSD